MEQSESLQVRVRRGRYDSIDLYEISKDELEILKQGSPNSIFLNFSIALFSVSLSLGATLLTVEIESNRVFYVFVLVLIVSIVAGIITAVLWLRGENSFNSTINRIEGRIQEQDYITTDTSIEALAEPPCS